MINVGVFEEIITGWTNLAFRNDEVVEEEAKRRLKFCVDCPQFSKRRFCEICGCYMPAKTRSKTSHCPMKVW